LGKDRRQRAQHEQCEYLKCRFVHTDHTGRCVVAYRRLTDFMMRVDFDKADCQSLPEDPRFIRRWFEELGCLALDLRKCNFLSIGNLWHSSSHWGTVCVRLGSLLASAVVHGSLAAC
jgi:hypothetical protein